MTSHKETDRHLTDSDSLLLEKFRSAASRRYAFHQLVLKYQQMLYHHIRRIVVDHDDADDLLQDTFIKIWNNLDKFKAEAKLSTWMYRIATNEALSFLRKKRHTFFMPLNDVANELAAKMTASENVCGDEVEQKLNRVLLTLPDKQRLVFHMKYYDEMSYNDISEVLGTSVGALKASYHHAVKKIEKSLTID